ncbi:GTP-binding protein, partial [archaeon]
MANRVDPSYLLDLQDYVDRIRNFCILAHVDHGKTTLSDSLVSSNGIISPRLAGKLRFLDSTEEEQKRGITMHSSAIALLYRMEEKGAEAAKEIGTKEDFLINLVDCPGHIDFSSDVSTAARLCDGALIVVDVLEGVCTQTHAVIYKALRERMKPCLVLNKLDRLIVESKLSPTEAFHHLRRLIEQVNALSFVLVKSELLKQAMECDPNFAEFVLDDAHPLLGEWTFSPDKNNVQFASALDGWGFGLVKCINMLTKKLGLNRSILRQYLFEDYYINLETKKIGKVDSSDYSKCPMFASLVLQPIWELYECAVGRGDMQELTAMVTDKLTLPPLPPRELNPRDMRVSLQAIMRRYMPLAESLLRMVVKVMPSPREGQERRLDTLLPLDFYNSPSSSTPTTIPLAPTPSSPTLPSSAPIFASTPSLTPPLQCICMDIKTCSRGAESALVVFISKMMPVRATELTKPDWALV